MAKKILLASALYPKALIFCHHRHPVALCGAYERKACERAKSGHHQLRRSQPEAGQPQAHACAPLQLQSRVQVTTDIESVSLRQRLVAEPQPVGGQGATLQSEPRGGHFFHKKAIVVAGHQHHGCGLGLQPGGKIGPFGIGGRVKKIAQHDDRIGLQPLLQLAEAGQVGGLSPAGQGNAVAAKVSRFANVQVSQQQPVVGG
jgi:hypothetical protein